MPPRPMIRATPRGKAAIVAAVIAAAAAGFYGHNEPVPVQVQLAISTLRPWEGRELRAYLDRIANPPVWTVCDGDTLDVKPNMLETPEGCDKRMITRMMRDFYKPLKKCIPGFDDKPVSWGAMMLSLAWNIGVRAACASTAARLGIAGNYLGSCIAATAFNKAGGKVIVGLVRRREMGDASRIGEAELCVSGL